MRDIVVAIDLETTGLNAQKDEIIEIGAVKFQDAQVLETYRTLIKPEQSIPPRVTAITGIRPDDVSSAPKLRDVLPALKQFVGDHAILGHNVGFDLDFLKQGGAPFANPTIDTYELASALLPTTPRYNLNALMQELGLQPDGEYHSALADAKATSSVFMALWERLLNDLPLTVLQDIVTATQSLDWRGRLPFEAALAERKTEMNRAGRSIAPHTADAVHLDAPFPSQPTPTPEIQPETRIEVEISLTSPVAEALANNQHLLMEVPSDVNRIDSYLLPALRFATQHDQRVIVSANSAELQNHLLEHDIPAALSALSLDRDSAVMLKGRAYYLCPRRLETLRRRPPTSIEELRVLAKILVWGEAAATGDRDDISLRGPAEYVAWTRLSAEDEHCTLHRCEAQMAGSCPFHRARRAADSAKLVLVNHGLLMSDGTGDDQVLPDYQYAILDEAHHLEDATTYALGVRLDLPTFRRQFADLGTLDSGLIGDVAAVIGAALPDKLRDRTINYLRPIAASVHDMAHHGDALFNALASFLASAGGGRGDFLMQLRMTDALREKTAFEPVRTAWSVLREFTGGIAEAMLKLSNSLTTLQDRYAIPALPDLIASTHAASAHLDAIHRQLTAFIEQPDSNTVYWLEAGQDQTLPTLRAAPLHVGPIVNARLWSARRSVTLTGTTLQAGSGFDYLRDRLSATDNIREEVIGGATDAASTLLYLPTDIAEPQEKNQYQAAVERGIIELAATLEGQLLALFTSYAQLRQTVQAVAPRLALSDITLFDQSDGTSKGALIDGFISTPKAVLFGNKAFWEDLELPPDDLAALIITRLPFAAPGDPVIGARAELLRNDSFNAYSVPDAVLRFRQGFGRLARTRTGQRGVVTVFDRRLLSKAYGQTFIDSLPACTIKRGPLAELAGTAKLWLDEAETLRS